VSRGSRSPWGGRRPSCQERRSDASFPLDGPGSRNGPHGRPNLGDIRRSRATSLDPRRRCSRGVAANPDCVRPLPLTRVMALLPDGREQPPAPGDGLGRTYHYDFDGSDVTEVVPPPGWTPLNGNEQELRTYGLPARPTDPAELQDWITSFSHWRGGAAEGMCVTGQRALGSFDNHRWGGGMSSGTATYVQANRDGTRLASTALPAPYRTRVTPLGSGLAAGTAVASYRAGTAASHLSVNGIYTRWEALRPGACIEAHHYQHHLLESRRARLRV